MVKECLLKNGNGMFIKECLLKNGPGMCLC